MRERERRTERERAQELEVNAFLNGILKGMKNEPSLQHAIFRREVIFHETHIAPHTCDSHFNLESTVQQRIRHSMLLIAWLVH